MMGFSETSISSHEAIETASVEQFHERIVSMAYVSGGERFAVIDGHLFKEGDTLQDVGASVRSITPDKVLLAGKEIRQWLKVNNPTGKQLTIAGSAFDKTTVASSMAAKAKAEAEEAAAKSQQAVQAQEAAKSSVMDTVNQQVEKMQNVSDVLNQLQNMF